MTGRWRTPTAASPAACAHQCLRLRDRVGDLHRLEREPELARLDPREVQQVIDDREQMPASRQHLVERLTLALLELVALEQLAEAEDRVERRAQLVADAREET